MLTSVDVQFTSIVHHFREIQQLKVCSGLQIYSIYCFQTIFRCETSTMSARQFRHFVQTTKTTQPRPQVSSTPLITTITVIVSLGVLIFLIATCVKLCCRPEKTNSSRNSLTTIRRYNNRAGTGFPTFSITTALPTRRLWSA